MRTDRTVAQLHIYQRFDVTNLESSTQSVGAEAFKRRMIQVLPRQRKFSRMFFKQHFEENQPIHIPNVSEAIQRTTFDTAASETPSSLRCIRNSSFLAIGIHPVSISRSYEIRT